MDMDSGVLHPMDHSVWDDGKGFLDNLLDDLSSSSDDSLFDFLNDMMMQEEDPSFDLDDCHLTLVFVTWIILSTPQWILLIFSKCD